MQEIDENQEPLTPQGPENMPEPLPHPATEPPKEKNWDMIKSPPKAPKEPAPEKTGPELAYSGNLREFRYDVLKKVKADMGTRLKASERAGVVKIFSERGGKFLGSKMERKRLKEFAAEQGWSAKKTQRILREARNLKGKTRAA